MKTIFLIVALLALAGCNEEYSFDSVTPIHIAKAEEVCQANNGLKNIHGATIWADNTKLIRTYSMYVECNNGANFTVSQFHRENLLTGNLL